MRSSSSRLCSSRAFCSSSSWRLCNNDKKYNVTNIKQKHDNAYLEFSSAQLWLLRDWNSSRPDWCSLHGWSQDRRCRRLKLSISRKRIELGTSLQSTSLNYLLLLILLEWVVFFEPLLSPDGVIACRLLHRRVLVIKTEKLASTHRYFVKTIN